jgi:hypothetical protein
MAERQGRSVHGHRDSRHAYVDGLASKLDCTGAAAVQVKATGNY